MPQRRKVSRSSSAASESVSSANSTSTGKLPRSSASFPAGTTVTPLKPRAASRAVSSVEATATLVSTPMPEARREISRATFVSGPKSFSRPEMSSKSVSGAQSSTRGEKDCAQSSKAWCADNSCSSERSRKVILSQTSACSLVMPVEIPAPRASSFSAQIFCSGGLPSRTAIA